MKKALIITSVASMIQQFNKNNIKILLELGFDVEIATNFEHSGNITREDAQRFKQELIDNNIKCYDIPFSRNPISPSNIKAYFKLKRIIEENNYNIAYMQSPIGAACGRLACRKLRKKNLKVIYTAHGFHFYKGAPLLNWAIYYPIEKILAHFTDCLITTNKEDYELAKKKMKVKDIRLVYGVGANIPKFDIEMSNDNFAKKRRELGLDIDDFVIIQVGELNKNKNQKILIEALNDLKKEQKIKVLLVGIGKLEEIYREMINKYGLTDKVKLLGYRKDIPELLKISNCLVSLSHREGLGMNAIEGMIAKIPVVLSKNRGHVELEVDPNFMLDADDKDRLEEIIINIKNGLISKKILEENYKKALQFSDEKVNSEMKKVFKEYRI